VPEQSGPKSKGGVGRGLRCDPFPWEEAGSPSNTMSRLSPVPRPTSVPSGVLFHPALAGIDGHSILNLIGAFTGLEDMWT